MGNDNASSALKFAIGLVITMIFIGIIIVAFTFGRNHANSAISNVSKDTSTLEDGRYTQYDGVMVPGAEVLNTIEKFEADNIFVAVTVAANTRATVTAYNDQQLGSQAYIMTSASTSGALTKNTVANENTLLRAAKDPTNAQYINPSAQFYGLVNRSQATGAVLGISFFRVEG